MFAAVFAAGQSPRSDGRPSRSISRESFWIARWRSDAAFPRLVFGYSPLLHDPDERRGRAAHDRHRHRDLAQVRTLPAGRRSYRAALVYMIVTCMTLRGCLLRRLWSPQGVQFATDLVFHDVQPALTAAVLARLRAEAGSAMAQHPWLLVSPPRSTSPSSLVTGALGAGYPYGFLDAAKARLSRSWCSRSAWCSWPSSSRSARSRHRGGTRPSRVVDRRRFPVDLHLVDRDRQLQLRHAVVEGAPCGRAAPPACRDSPWLSIHIASTQSSRGSCISTLWCPRYRSS